MMRGEERDQFSRRDTQMLLRVRGWRIVRMLFHAIEPGLEAARRRLPVGKL
jgi:hypothetical protein